ncbi:MAG: hypothetical protein QHH06_10250 [Clostridiales bacterium]|jgi:hypothetical protein|nr:hypothetical protein [Eubacteriales bacterium]MDH7566846.1 hypothetical protein [Clostridiales bacterium]
MIFLGNLEQVSETKYRIGFIHNMPFDPEHGMKDQNGVQLTDEQLSQMGILVDSLPEEQPPLGQVTKGIFVNLQTREVWYEYGTPPKTQEQVLTELQEQSAQMLFVLVANDLM